MVDKLSSIFNRIFFIIAFTLLSVAVFNWFIGLFGWTLSFIPYQPGRLFEFSGIFILFVMALLLRQIREYLKPKS